MHLPFRVALVAVVVGSLLLVPAVRVRPAAAHPLGNFTINHFDRLTPSDAGIDVYSVLDMAEIPAFRERQQIDADGSGDVDARESEEYAEKKVESLRSDLVLSLNGHNVPLIPVRHELTFPAGQAGLAVLRLSVTYWVALPAGWQSSQVNLKFEDNADSGRLGWREIVILPGGGVRLTQASVSSEDQTAELTAYPADALSSPLDVHSATAAFVAAAGAAAEPPAAPHANAVRGNPDSALARFASLVAAKHVSAGVVVLALLAAMGFGAIHALSPGHGKTIVAAYLVGSKGSARHALLLGLTVTLTHTSSVYALGFISLYLSQYVVPERIYPWLTIASGALIILMGAALLVGRLRSSNLVHLPFGALKHKGGPIANLLAVAHSEAGAARVGARPAVRLSRQIDPGAHPHGRDTDEQEASMHRHGIGPAHSHSVPGSDGQPITWRRLVGLGIFGGLLPCPSAIVVMLSAISLHRVGFGLVLIVAFSVGLAGVLTAIGFGLVYGRRLATHVPALRSLTGADSATSGVVGLAVRAFPVASAAAVIIAGCVLITPAVFRV